jgi:hypothetical protein
MCIFGPKLTEELNVKDGFDMGPVLERETE